MSDFKTLSAEVFQQTYVVQKSRFLAYAKRVDSVTEAQAFLKSVALPDATHHCYAYLTLDGQKSSDNGEPSGTAGIPILQAIKQCNLINVAVAVERYFGGIKLGTGGLARAYGQAASQVLATAKTVLVRECMILEFTTAYDQKLAVDQLVAAYGQQINLQYSDMIAWRVAVPLTVQNKFLEKLAEVRHGDDKVDIIEKQAWVEFVV